MMFDISVIRERLKGLDPMVMLRVQILAHAFLIITGFASSIVFTLTLINKDELLVSVSGGPGVDTNTQDPTESPVQNNDILVMTTLMVVFVHSSLSIISSSIFLIANRWQLRSEMVLSNRVQVTVLSINVFVTFILIVVSGVLRERMEHSLTGSVPAILIQGLPVYLALISGSILVQLFLIFILSIGRLHFTQLVEDDEENGHRVRLEIQADASPQVQVQLPSDNKAMKQVRSLLTLPGRDRIASLRSLHKYDPVNTSPGMFAVPLTPFDSQTGTWSSNPTPDKPTTPQHNIESEKPKPTDNVNQLEGVRDESPGNVTNDDLYNYNLQVLNNTVPNVSTTNFDN